MGHYDYYYYKDEFKNKKVKFSQKLAKKIAQEQFNWTLGCVIGTDDPDYNLMTDIDSFEQNFEEKLEEYGINLTQKRIASIKKHYEKMNDKAFKCLNKMIK